MSAAKPSRAGLILTNANDQILLVKGRLMSKWSIPKGQIEPTDKTLRDAGIREFTEETGVELDFKHDAYLGELTIEDVHVVFYETDREISLENLSNDVTEIAEVAWFDKSSLRSLKNANRSLRMYALHYLYKNWHAPKKGKKKLVVDDEGWCMHVNLN